MDSASGSPAMCLPREKCAPIEEWRLQAQYRLKSISIFQRQQRVCLVHTTGWKQYLVASQGWAWEVCGQNCAWKAGQGGKPNPSFQVIEKEITPQPEGAALAQEICSFVSACGIGKSALGQLESGKLLSSASGGEKLLTPGAPGGASCSLMKEEHPVPFLALLKKGQLKRMMSEDQRFAVKSPFPCGLASWGQELFLRTHNSIFSIMDCLLASPLAGLHLSFSCVYTVPQVNETRN